MSNAVEALKSYGQLDEEGIFVSVSRQAIEETLDELAECEVAILREKRRVDSLHMKINGLEAELEGTTKVMEILTKLGSHDIDAAKWIAEARELLGDLWLQHGYGGEDVLELTKIEAAEFISRRDALLGAESDD